MGDTVFANIVMLGFSWQRGLVPVGFAALDRAIELNGVAIEANRHAFLIGRIAAAMPERLAGLLAPQRAKDETLDEIVARRVAFLTDYQDAGYAGRYAAFVDKVARVEAPLGSEELARTVARALFRLMAYKDEYEVARLHTETGFADGLKAGFEGDFRIVHHLAPPFLAAGRDARGRPLKRAFGPWIRLPMRVLARMKRLRGTLFDPFGHTVEWRMERALIGWYEEKVERVLDRLDGETHAGLCRVLARPLDIRGYGPVKEEAARRVRAEVEAALAG
jgi:indolepyruvate ferredoxin oxidoreductase